MTRGMCTKPVPPREHDRAPTLTARTQGNATKGPRAPPRLEDRRPNQRRRRPPAALCHRAPLLIPECSRSPEPSGGTPGAVSPPGERPRRGGCYVKLEARVERCRSEERPIQRDE